MTEIYKIKIQHIKENIILNLNTFILNIFHNLSLKTSTAQHVYCKKHFQRLSKHSCQLLLFFHTTKI